jgi:AraC-like DNA-binding protein
MSSCSIPQDRDIRLGGRALDQAAHLIERRALMNTGQPLSDIAYACGYRDYTHFARGFRQRFGTAPGADPAI